jgi:transposase
VDIIALDSHKHYTLASVETREGRRIREERIQHQRGSIQKFLAGYHPGTPVAVETIGNWYWIVDEIEQAGMIPKLVHARKAKLMLGSINKTDKLDARGLNTLQRTGTLPTVWIPPGEIRDKRELARTRMVLTRERTRLKNRIHSVLDKYGMQDEFEDISDIFGKRARQRIRKVTEQLPPQTSFTMSLLLEQLERTEKVVADLERQMKEVFKETEEIALLMSQPGVGFILAVVIIGEIGDISRFHGPEYLAAYAGTTPRVHSSGGKTRYGGLRSDVNHYLKWAYSEAANSVAVNRRSHPHRHVSTLYIRIRQRKGHAKAVGAVARHLSEATYWMLTKKELYRERGVKEVSSQRDVSAMLS